MLVSMGIKTVSKEDDRRNQFGQGKRTKVHTHKANRSNKLCGNTSW